MKITLRKANAVQLSMADTVKSLKFDSTVSLNEFQDVEKVLYEASTKFLNNLSRRRDMMNALLEIRLAVGKANKDVGIDQRLTEIAYLEKQIQFLSAFAQSESRENLDVIKGRLDKIRNRKEDSRLYTYNDSVATSLFTEQDIGAFKSDVQGLKKAKQKLQDEVLELNVRTEIELSQGVIDILTGEGLV